MMWGVGWDGVGWLAGGGFGLDRVSALGVFSTVGCVGLSPSDGRLALCECLGAA